MKSYRKYFKSNGADKDLELIDAEIEKIEEKFKIEIYARLDVGETGIVPVIAFNKK